MDAKSFEAARDSVSESRQALYKATESEIQVREILKNREADFILIGLEGKNEKEREAQLRTQTVVQRSALISAEQEKRFAALALELALDNRRCLEYCLKVEELSQ